MNPSPSSQPIPALTGLRGYAALWVVLSHLSFTPSLSTEVGLRLQWRLADGLLRHEYLAVDLFFILSGFVLTHAHARELDQQVEGSSYVRFLLLRLARVYPLHLLALLATALMLSHAPDSFPANHTGSFLLQLGLMASWGFCSSVSWNAPAWSLSSEWLAYLVLPLMILCSARLQRMRSQLFVVFIILAVFRGLFFNNDFSLGLDLTNGAGASARVIIGVALGSVLRRLYDQPSIRKLPWTALFWLAVPVAAAFMTDLSGRRLTNNPWAFIAIGFLVFAAACASPRGLLPFTSRVPVYLGEISYAVYIFHYPVLRTLGLLVGPRLDAIARTGSATGAHLVAAGAMLIVIGVAAFAHHAVEKPVRRLARRWIDQRYPIKRA